MFIFLIVIQSCFSVIFFAKKIKMKIIKDMELRYKTKAKMEELLAKDYQDISNEDGVKVIEIKPGLKLIEILYAENFKLISLKNNGI